MLEVWRARKCIEEARMDRHMKASQCNTMALFRLRHIPFVKWQFSGHEELQRAVLTRLLDYIGSVKEVGIRRMEGHATNELRART